MAENKRRFIAFDLDTNALKQYYNADYKKAYNDIGKFFLKNGFKHRQWSGYVSEKPMSDSTVMAIITNLKNTFPWLKMCTRRFDVAEVGKLFDLTHEIIGEMNSKSPEKSKTISEAKTSYPNSFVLDNNNDNGRNSETYKIDFENGSSENKTSFLSANITVKKEKSLSELSAYAKGQCQKQSAELENTIGKDEISSDIGDTER